MSSKCHERWKFTQGALTWAGIRGQAAAAAKAHAPAASTRLRVEEVGAPQAREKSFNLLKNKSCLQQEIAVILD